MDAPVLSIPCGIGDEPPGVAMALACERPRVEFSASNAHTGCHSSWRQALPMGFRVPEQ
jgi:hypothetical protein